jgi:hypothetical protein
MRAVLKSSPARCGGREFFEQALRDNLGLGRPDRLGIVNSLDLSALTGLLTTCSRQIWQSGSSSAEC